MQEIMAMFNVTREMEYRVVRFNVAAGTSSNLLVRMVDCERTINRWSNGNEVMTYYHRYDTPRHVLGPYEEINHTTEGWRVDTQEELRQRIATDLFNDYDQGWNFNWEALAAFLSAHVHGTGGGGANFNLEVETVVVDQAVADQDVPYWRHYFAEDVFVDLANRQRVPDACPICYGDVANPGARIGLKCGHVFCKACLYAWIWRRVDCPMCRGGALW